MYLTPTAAKLHPKIKQWGKKDKKLKQHRDETYLKKRQDVTPREVKRR